MSGPWYEPEAREIADVCERCGEAGDTVLGPDGELCAPCREELSGERAPTCACGADASGWVMPAGGVLERCCEACRSEIVTEGITALMAAGERWERALCALAAMRLRGEDPLLPYDRSAERGAVLEELRNVAKNQPLWPGDTISPYTARECARLGWIERNADGDWVTTPLGASIALAHGGTS